MPIFLNRIFVFFCTVTISGQALAGTGACCLGGGVCYDTINEITCQIFEGVWHPGLTCEDVICETNCGGACLPGEITGCDGDCAPVAWIGDGICDSSLNCEVFGYDGGDCNTPPDLPMNPGACCIGDFADCEDKKVCENLSYELCVNSNGLFLGENTFCMEETCNCPPGQLADCEGNCFPIYYLNDGLCHEGHGYPENGDDPWQYDLSLDCLALACDLGDCNGVCTGACCIGHACIDDMSFEICAKQGGTFLGGGESCLDVDCSGYLVSQTIGTEITDLDPLLTGDVYGSVAAQDGIIVTAIYDCNNENNQSCAAMNVFRNGGTAFIQTLHTIDSSNQNTIVDTDGTRVVLAINDRILIYVDNGITFDFEQELSFSDDGPFGSIAHVSISGDRLIANAHWGDYVHEYRLNGKGWQYHAAIGPQPHPIIKAVIDGDSMAVQMVYLSLIFDYEGSGWVQKLSHDSATPDYNDVDISGNYVILGETTDYYPGSPSVAQVRLFKRAGTTWVADVNLITPESSPDDDFGYKVSIDGDVACISAIRSDTSLVDGGVVSCFKKIGTNWQYVNRIMPFNPQPAMNFGRNLANDGKSIVVGYKRQPGIFEVLSRGTQLTQLPDHEWVEPEGGDINAPVNWIPDAPSIGDHVSIAIPAKFELDVSSDLPFSHLQVGPSQPILNLQGQSVSLGTIGDSSIHVEGSPFFTGNLEISTGVLTSIGNVQIGSQYRPGALSIANDATVIVEGDYVQSRNSQLRVTLGSTSDATLQLQGNAYIQGSLTILPPLDSFDPQVGLYWTIVEALNLTDSDADRFDVSVMPGIGSSKYFDLQYLPVGNGVQLVATVTSIENLFDLEDSDSVYVDGRATDIAVADIGSPDGPPDGFDDIALTVGGSPGSVYIFINDGTGNVDSQITYSAGDGPSSLDAGDLDGDGTLDLAIANANDDSFFVLLNDGGTASSMTTLAPVSTGDLPVDILIINIDDDVDNDVVIACHGEEPYNSSGGIAGELRFYEATPSMRVGFTLAGAIPLEKPGKIDPGDVTNPKDIDIMITSNVSSKSVVVKRDSGASGFDWSVVQEIAVGANPDAIDLGDLDNDGDDDAVIANRGSDNLSILVKNSTGEYDDEIVIEVGDRPTSLDLLDYDGDNDLDLAVIAGDDNDQRAVFIYRNDTSLNPANTITFSLEQTLDAGLGPILVGSGELDEDAAEDLVSILESTSGFRSGVSDSIVEIHSVPAVLTCPGDLNSSGVVNISDLLIVIAGWGSAEGDANGDGYTDIEDILVVINAWGPCN